MRVLQPRRRFWIGLALTTALGAGLGAVLADTHAEPRTVLEVLGAYFAGGGLRLAYLRGRESALAQILQQLGAPEPRFRSKDATSGAAAQTWPPR